MSRRLIVLPLLLLLAALSACTPTEGLAGAQGAPGVPGTPGPAGKDGVAGPSGPAGTCLCDELLKPWAAVTYVPGAGIAASSNVASVKPLAAGHFLVLLQAHVPSVESVALVTLAIQGAPVDDVTVTTWPDASGDYDVYVRDQGGLNSHAFSFLLYRAISQ